jgi:hypothetical protein
MPSDKPAAWLTDGCRVDFWREIPEFEKSCVMAGDEDTATYVDVSAGPMSTAIRLEWPKDRAIVEHFQYIAARAHKSGQYAARQQLRRWIGGEDF